MRSQAILKRYEFSFNRAVYKSMGFSDSDLEKPIIGIANTWSDLVPGSTNLRQVAEHVKKGIQSAGGTAVEFGVIGACDGTAQGCEGMRYILPSRELIANDVEVMVQAHQLDGIVLLGSCDKIVPGLLMAAARLDIPAILLPGGPMQGGAVFDGKASDLTSLSEGCGMLSAGRVTEEELVDLEESCCPGCGSCSFYGTANTMCCLAEALGMTLPGGALIPAVYAERLRMAARTGEAIVNLVNNQINARQIINKKSLSNAVRVLNATGGSTNGVLHLLAIGYEAGIKCEEIMDMVEKYVDDTPLVAKVNPASQYNMEDFYLAGGIPAVMKAIAPLLAQDVMTVTGKTVKENLEKARKAKQGNPVIKTMESPFSKSGGIAVLRGNLAEDGCITKPSAIDPQMQTFTGSARVFDSEEAAEEAILSGDIHEGDVLVIRYEGPKGGPGMREMYKAMKYLYGRGLAKSTAIVTDGRFSGTNNGCFAGHISPEASEGGVIAVVEDGDRITIDIPNKAITLHVEEEELARRFENWCAPAPKYRTGYLGVYSRLASSASRGGVLDAWGN